MTSDLSDNMISIKTVSQQGGSEENQQQIITKIQC